MKLLKHLMLDNNTLKNVQSIIFHLPIKNKKDLIEKFIETAYNKIENLNEK